MHRKRLLNMEVDPFEEILEIERNWHKATRDLKKAGWRDGISDGRNSNFQKNFNHGFSEGFTNAFPIGEFKGSLLNYSKDDQEDLRKTELLEKSLGGWCQLCLNKQLFTQNKADIIANQTEKTQENTKELKDLFSTKTSIS